MASLLSLCCTYSSLRRTSSLQHPSPMFPKDAGWEGYIKKHRSSDAQSFLMTKFQEETQGGCSIGPGWCCEAPSFPAYRIQTIILGTNTHTHTHTFPSLISLTQSILSSSYLETQLSPSSWLCAKTLVAGLSSTLRIASPTVLSQDLEYVLWLIGPVGWQGHHALQVGGVSAQGPCCQQVSYSS